MPKVVTKKFSQRPEKKKEDRAATSASAASAASRAFGPLFNKDLGQHILKNPLVAQGIVDKVRLQERENEEGTCDGDLL
jgi:18S rRNA (adenine1779-N6/adenine1780-N6)-dimethyltransferase